MVGLGQTQSVEVVDQGEVEDVEVVVEEVEVEEMVVEEAEVKVVVVVEVVVNKLS